MNYEDKIIDLANNNNGYITTKMVTEKNIAKTYLTELVKSKKIIKVSRGLYMLPECFEDEYYKLQTSNRKSVYSLETALYLHGLNDRIPTILDITVISNYGGNLLKNKNVKLNYVKNDIFNLGIMEMNSPMDMPIKVYDIDKTICDIVKNKSKIDPEIFSKALKEYIYLKNKNISNLILYARKMKIENKVREYIEVIL